MAMSHDQALNKLTAKQWRTDEYDKKKEIKKNNRALHAYIL